LNYLGLILPVMWGERTPHMLILGEKVFSFHPLAFLSTILL